MLKVLRSSIIIVLFSIFLCGIMYPAMVTAIGFLFPHQANGSLIEHNNRIIGSELIGQQFDDPGLFHGRPSTVDYNINVEEPKSGSSNLATFGSSKSSKELKEIINERILKLIEENPAMTGVEVPEELYTSSASGLDPHISVEGALYQTARISDITGIHNGILQELVLQNTEYSPLAGEQVNVLKLNIDLIEYIKEH